MKQVNAIGNYWLIEFEEKFCEKRVLKDSGYRVTRRAFFLRTVHWSVIFQASFLGDRPTAGHMALDHGIGVRIPISQQTARILSYREHAGFRFQVCIRR